MKAVISKLPVIVYFIAAAGIGVQLWAGTNYPMFRDEFYYLECAKHLAWGYVDHPPLSILKLWAWTSLYGDSLLSMRIIPSALFGMLIFVVSLLTLEMRRDSFAAAISALAVFSSPQLLGVMNFYSMNAIDLVLWAVLFLLIAMIINGGDRKLWLIYGAILGLGLMNKFSIGIFAAAMIAGMLFTRHGKGLLNKYFLVGHLIAFLIFIPFLIWNFLHGFPTAEFMENAANYKNAELSLIDFLLAQFINMGPVNSLICLAGLLSLLFVQDLRPFRLTGYIFIFTFLFLVLQNSKPYYLAGAYPPLFAAGAITVSALAKGRLNTAAKYSTAVLLVVSFIVFSPLAIPVLPPEAFTYYSTVTGIRTGKMEKHEAGILPQHFADRFGWKELAELVAAAYNSLPEQEKRIAAIYADNYGEAGAINYYGRESELPNAISGHNNFWLWGPGETEVKVLIVAGGSKEVLAEIFDDVQEFGRTNNTYCMPYENNLPVFIARKPKADLRSLWAGTKHFM